jgi:hypothetical protein
MRSTVVAQPLDGERDRDAHRHPVGDWSTGRDLDGVAPAS